MFRTDTRRSSSRDILKKRKVVTDYKYCSRFYESKNLKFKIKKPRGINYRTDENAHYDTDLENTEELFNIRPTTHYQSISILEDTNSQMQNLFHLNLSTVTEHLYVELANNSIQRKLKPCSHTAQTERTTVKFELIIIIIIIIIISYVLLIIIITFLIFLFCFLTHVTSIFLDC